VHHWHLAGVRRLLRFSAGARVEISRSHPPRTSAESARCPWPPRWAANHWTDASEVRPDQASDPTATYGGGSPFRLTTLMGFTPFAVLILIAGPADVSIRRPTCRSPNVHPGSAIFSNTGRPAVFPASGRSWPSRPPIESAVRPVTDVQPGFWVSRRQSSRAAGALLLQSGRTALGFASRRFAGDSRHACRVSKFSARRQPREEVPNATLRPAASFRFRFLTLLSFGGRSFL